MKVLFASSEAAPFLKTGGLGDVVGSLPAVLREKGVDARVIMPLYKCIDKQYKDKMKYIDHIYIDMAWRKQYAGVFELEHNGCIYYFIDKNCSFADFLISSSVCIEALCGKIKLSLYFI